MIQLQPLELSLIILLIIAVGVIVCMAVIIAILLKKYCQVTSKLSAAPSSPTSNQAYELVDQLPASHTPAEYEIPTVSKEPQTAGVEYEMPIVSHDPATILTKNMAYTTWLAPSEALPSTGESVAETVTKVDD